MRMISFETIVSEIKRQAPPGGKIVFVSGNFNVVHPGHLRLLRFASDCGDFLVVGVNGDQSPGAIVPQELRVDGVRSIGLVDYAFLLPDAPEEFVARLQPAVVVKGKEHETRSNPEQGAVDSYGGKLLFSSGDVVFSSMDLLRREFVEPNLSSISKPLDFPDRHGFTLEDLRRTLGTKVRIISGKKRGTIYIEYYSHVDLDRILSIIGCA